MKFNQSQVPLQYGELVIALKIQSVSRWERSGVLASLADMFQSGMVGWRGYIAGDRAVQERGARCTFASWASLQHCITSLAALSTSINPSLSLPPPSLCHSHCSSCVHPLSLNNIIHISNFLPSVRLSVSFLCFSSVLIPFYRGSVCSNSALPPFFDD